MNIALIIIYVFCFISLLINANMHGKKKTGEHNFWVSLISIIINLVLIWWALGWRLI